LNSDKDCEDVWAYRYLALQGWLSGKQSLPLSHLPKKDSLGAWLSGKHSLLFVINKK